MKLLCAVMACWWRESYVDAQRQTWAKKTPEIDIRFFFGKGAQREPKEDEVHLDCGDHYLGLPEKVRLAFKWALEHDYDFAFKCDDDTYVVPERLVAAEKGDFIGRYMGACVGYPYGFCSGGAGYWVSKRALEIIANAEVDEEAEDRWVANTLGDKGITGKHDDRYRVTLLRSDPRNNPLRNMYFDYPRAGNKIASVCEFNDKEMEIPHQIWLNSLNRVNEVKSKIRLL